MIYATITSKKAQKHLEKIKAQHTRMLQDMDAHKNKVLAYHQQKLQEEKEEMKEAREIALKQQELNIKSYG